MKKKIVSGLLSVMMIVMAVGCGSQVNEDAAADSSSVEASVDETVNNIPEIKLEGTLEYGWATDHISDEDYGEMSNILEKEEIAELDDDSRFQRVYGDLSMEVSVWDLLSVGEGNKDYNDYGTVVVTGSGKYKTAYPEVRHGRCPAVGVDYDDNTMWLVGEAISENGVHAEIPYYFSIGTDKSEMIYAVDPVLVQEKLLEMITLNVTEDKISFNSDGNNLCEINNPGDVESICIGDHISYTLNAGNDLIVKVTPGIKTTGSSEADYENMPTIIGTLVPTMGSDGVYNDFEIKALSALAYNQVSLDNPTALDDAISSAILKSNAGMYSQGELAAEGHILMSSEEDGPQVKAYCLAMYGEYEFQNGNFVKCSGSGAIPTVITFVLNDSKEYTLVSYEEAEDGSNFVPSIKRMFPEDLWARCITTDEDDFNELNKLERGYAQEYVSGIEREDAEVGDYADFEYEYDSDYGIPEEVSNEISEVQSSNSFINRCPMWYGYREAIEEGIRYVYKKEYDKTENKIIFSKVDYETGEVVESEEFSAEK